MPNLNISMVAFHGTPKPASLQLLLTDLYDQLAGALGSSCTSVFEPYGPEQIHATLIGMEANVDNYQFFSYWFSRNRSGEKRLLHVAHLREIVERATCRAPMFTIRFGGFRKAHCTCVAKSAEGWNCATSGAEFHSCDRSAYDGSFYGFSHGPVLLTGWPVQSSTELEVFPHLLYNFRLAAEQAGFLDKYHSEDRPHWMDDDCYLKLGFFRKEITEDQLINVEEAVREYLRNRGPVTVDLRVEDVSIVLYKDPSLKKKDVIDKVSLADFISDHRKVELLYDRLLRMK